MSNTLTNLEPDLYEAMDVISREIVGLLPAVSRDSSLERAALNQTIRSFVAPASTAADIVPAQIAPNTGDQTIGNKTITISKSRGVPVRWNGEDQKGMNTGPGYGNIRRDQFAQAMRTLVNEMESFLANLGLQASRAIKPAGTHLFDAANYKDIANCRRVLVENGAPLDNMCLVLNPLEGAAFRGNAGYYAQYQSGLPADVLSQGILMDIHGVKIRESQQIVNFTHGTASSAATDTTGYAVGSTTIALEASTGTGTILPGDVITFAGDPNHYVVVTGSANVDTTGQTVVISAPGLKVALAASNVAITVETPSERNMMFSANAIHMVTRLPARPEEGDNAIDVTTVTDPRSGISFEIAMYKEYRQVHYEVSCAYGASVIKPEHLALLIDN